MTSSCKHRSYEKKQKEIDFYFILVEFLSLSLTCHRYATDSRYPFFLCVQIYHCKVYKNLYLVFFKVTLSYHTIKNGVIVL